MKNRSRSFPLSILIAALAMFPLQAWTQESFEDNFDSGSLNVPWSTWDGYAAAHPADTANHAAFDMTGSALSISFPGGYEHNQWWLKHAAVLRSFPGSGTYETKIESPFTGSQQVGLVFQGDEPGTFLMFMLYATDQVRAYVERFTNVGGQQYKYTYSGGSLGLHVPAAGPYYLRVTVEDHPSPSNRSWRFEWSNDGTSWLQLVAGSLEGAADHQNAGTIQSVGLFAGNQPYTFDGYDAEFDYFKFTAEDDLPLPAPSNLVTRAGDGRVDLWWDPVDAADVYSVYASSTEGGPYTLAATTIEPRFTDFAVSNGSLRSYVVSAFSGGIEGEASEEVLAVPHASIVPADLPVDGLILALNAAELAYVTADGEPVTHWASANGPLMAASTAAGQAPRFYSSGLNGQPTLRFDGADDYLSLPAGFDDFSSGLSLFIVARPTVLQHGFKLLALGNGAGQQNVVLGRAGSTAGLQYFTDNSFGAVGWFNTPSALVANQPMLISVSQQGGAADGASYAEVAADGSALTGQNVYVAPVVERTVNYIGRSYWNEGLFQGDISEILLYDRMLTESEKASVHRYVSEKYGLSIAGAEEPPPAPLEAPLQVTATAGDSTVSLEWSSVANAVGYRVYRSSGSAAAVQLADVSTPALLDNSVVNGTTYHYVVTAYDSIQESPPSSTVHATPAAQAGGGGEIELPTDGLILALSGETAALQFQDGQPVTAWTDGSGSGNSAVSGTGAPTLVANGLNGQPVLRFDGVDDFFTLPSGFEDFTGGISLYVVAKTSALQPGFKLVALGNGANQQNIVLGRAGSTSGLQYFTDNSAGAVGWFNTPGGLSAGGAAVYSVLQQPGTANSPAFAEVGRNGSSLYGDYVFVPPVAMRSVNYIGKSYWNEGMFEGDIAEILLYDRTLDSADQTAVLDYIEQKYGLPIQ